MTAPDLQIGPHRVGPGHPPFIIAEMSGNHNGSLDRALALVQVAADAGAHALKLQTYTPDTMTIDCDDPAFRIEDAGSLWAGETLYGLYAKAMTPWEWHAPIFERCRALGLAGFSSPFDSSAVDFLETLDVPCYKIASFENIDLPLIRKAAATGKPLIISTGMAQLSEIDEAVRAARAAGCEQLLLLKCTSSYPAPPEDTNLAAMPHLREMFGCHVGLSDHTMGIGAAIASVALGGVAIEKHFTLARADEGVDAAFSSEPGELEQMVAETARAAQAIGDVRFGPCSADEKSLQFRRTLYVVEDMKAGDVLTETNLRAIRPGFGLHPKFIGDVMGLQVRRDVKRGTPMSWDLLG